MGAPFSVRPSPQTSPTINYACVALMAMSLETEAAVLCGGRGERLRPLTDYFQKVMIPIGPKKLPLLVYVITLLEHHGVNRIAPLIGYRSEDVRR